MAHFGKIGKSFIKIARNHSKVFFRGKTTQSYWHTASSLQFTAETIPTAIDKAADTFGDNEAYVFQQQKIRKTFQQFKNDAESFAAGLVSLGLKIGDKIAIWCPNVYEFVLTQGAAAKAGLVLVPFNAGYQLQELETCLEKGDIACLVIGEKILTQDYYKIAGLAIPELSLTKTEVTSPRFPKLRFVISTESTPPKGTLSISHLMGAGGSTERKRIQEISQKVEMDDSASLLFTSGTTGKPKAADLTHRNLMGMMQILVKTIKFDENDTICFPPPFFHYLGSVVGTLGTLVSHSKLVVPSVMYSALPTLMAIQAEKCTNMVGSPTMFLDICSHPQLEKFDISSLKTIFTGTTICPESMLKATKEKLKLDHIYICYGSTEGGCNTLVLPDDIEKYKMTTVGRPFETQEAKVTDKDNRIVPVGTMGELQVKGCCVLRGYYKEDEKTVEVKDQLGWYKTGDIAVMNEDGYLQIMGRIKDIIIRGGSNIYPKEIEDYLYTHPNVQEIAVVGLPDDRLGEIVSAWIKLKENSKTTEVEIKTFCEGKILKTKIPEHVFFIDEFPRTKIGKIQKFALQEKYAEMKKNSANN